VSYYRNKKAARLKSAENKLFLNGLDIELISISINGIEPIYEVKVDGIEISNLEDEFILDIKNRIHPEKNTSLSGLYKSKGNYCTQCEAHGFRNITYYLDRPDVLSIFTTTINADSTNYPVLLSNGNLINKSSGSTTWHDPTPKPCYLFALVAGKFSALEDSYKTISGKQVDLKIYVEPHNIDKTRFAMDSLIRSFEWEEKKFGLEYDLDIYMVVAVDDFNMGAMENKGLNIFNSSYVLANPETATDRDFINIESVIGHEYFHNWTGNRVTCRDWFQLSLKEGLTVFRDQEFTSDLHSRAIKRIDDVNNLRTFQFAEDAGPMRHPVRPESYIEMNNFYTFTVYEKGAEVIRMIHTLLGEVGFQKGMKLYFGRHDGDAVTIDDFVSSMSDANNFDFTSFMNWYSKSGTPEVDISSKYSDENKTFSVRVRQNSEDTFMFPIRFALLDNKGEEIKSGVMIVDEKEKLFKFNDIKSKPTPSWLREFSAPIKLNTDLTNKQRIFLVGKDSDAFNRWDSAQSLWLSFILNPKDIDHDLFFEAAERVLKESKDRSLICEILTPPSERFIHQQVQEIDILDIHNKREYAISKFTTNFKSLLLDTYLGITPKELYDISPESVGNRALRNYCIYYLAKDGNFDLAYKHYISANCMTDKIAGFNALLTRDNPYKLDVIDNYYDKYKDDVQVMDKWFASQSISNTTTIDDVKELTKHELFSFNTPNRLRSVVGVFSQNYINFHNIDGYDFFTDIIIKLDKSNPQIGARLVLVYNHWKRFSPDLKFLQEKQLNKILNTKNLSKDVFEIVQAALK
jgi:aminopeptidase N